MRLPSHHAGAAAIAFHAIRPAISAEAGAILLGATTETTVTAAVLTERLASAIVSVVARVLNPAIAAYQSVISIRAAVRSIGTCAFICVPAAIGAEISIRVIAAVWTVMRVLPGLVIAVGMKCAIVAIPGMVLAAGRSAAELVVTAARSPTPRVISAVV